MIIGLSCTTSCLHSTLKCFGTAGGIWLVKSAELQIRKARFCGRILGLIFGKSGQLNNNRKHVQFRKTAEHV